MEDLPIRPRGLRLQADFITPAHEARLLHIFRHELDWPAARKPGARLSLHYGYTFDYRTFGVDPAIPHRPFPAWLRPLIPRVANRGRGRDGEGEGEREEEGDKEGDRDPDQVCLQHYPPGAGIPPHVDTHSAYDELYALSLGSPVIMQFRRTRDGEGGSGRETVDVDLPPRSMMQMSGDARLHWEHGIRKRRNDALLPGGAVRPRADRWSITFRWLRPGGACACGDLRLCDTAQKRAGVEREFRWKLELGETREREKEEKGEKGETQEQEKEEKEEKEEEKEEGKEEGEREGQLDGERQQRAEREVRGLGDGESGDGCESPDISIQRTEGTDPQHQHHKNDNILLSPP
ncbi:hypothetical protein F5B18DRAFT_676745 [Nemania serpens]|nr:hypothetical protein F5B18DRAFT_676745 [Nemania serpens]